MFTDVSSITARTDMIPSNILANSRFTLSSDIEK